MVQAGSHTDATHRNHTLADIVNRFRPRYLADFGQRIPFAHIQAMEAIAACRTQDMGGHVIACNTCDEVDYAYHSCRNRSCPRCGHGRKETWLAAKREQLLPVPYFHVVFTAPDELRRVIRTHQRLLYPVLMKAAGRSLVDFCAKFERTKGKVGVMAVLHTWTRALTYHPHVHCLVPAGVVDQNGQWRDITFLAPHKSLAERFRHTLIDTIQRTLTKAGVQPPEGLEALRNKPWVVHVDQPKHGVDVVLTYLARYVFRIAIDDRRILHVDDDTVTFKYRDRGRTKWKVMKLDGVEFLRRFLQHVLPKGFNKVRYYGFWNPNAKALYASIQEQLKDRVDATPLDAQAAGAEAADTARSSDRLDTCPFCSKGTRRIIGELPKRAMVPGRPRRHPLLLRPRPGP